MPQPDSWQPLDGARVHRARWGDMVGGALLGELATFAVGIVVLVASAAAEGHTPPPLVHLGKRKVRGRRHSMSWADIDSARLVRDFDLTEFGQLSIVFGSKRHFEIAVPLSDGKSALATQATRDTAILLLRDSSVSIPTDRYDPTGKFARSGSPSHLAKSEAIELVERPPMAGDPLPVAI